MILLTGVISLLHRYTGNQDFLVGVPIFKQGVTGELLNTAVALPNHLTDDLSFKDLLLQVRAVLTEAMKNPNYPLEKLVEDLNLTWERDQFPLFDLTVLLENIQDPAYLDHLSCNLQISFRRDETEIQVRATYHPSFYQRETIKRILTHLVSLLQEALRDLDKPLIQLEILSATEREQILQVFNDTEREFVKDQTMQQLFERQVVRTPDRIAVQFADQSLTYAELNGRANRLAVLLRQKGVKPNQIVGILVERSLEMLIGIMGILKAGGAYLPISPEYPQERIEYMLADSKSQLILIGENGPELSGYSGEVIDLQQLDLTGTDPGNLETVNSSTDLAYTIYTSGSTGKPKGAMIEHRSVVNRLSWMQNQYPLTENDVILQKTPFTFDVSVWELFWWSLYGARVCFLAPGDEKNPQALVQAIAKEKITTMHFVPSMLNIFLKYLEETQTWSQLSTLRQVFASGEALTPRQVEKFRQLLFTAHGTQLHNLYGPTEATIDVSYYDCFAKEDQEIIPIGKPIDNTQLYILDQYQRVQPIGVPGELFIAGVGVGRGYLNRPDLTQEKFVFNPFLPSEKMYRTGDLARWLPDGNIEYLGRMDFQVKIRGFRIEPGEIESKLNTHPLVEEGIIQTWEDQNGEKHLCAYIVTDADLSIGELKRYLALTLPEYMIPAYFIKLDQLPLSNNGKLDRKALPEPDGSMMTGAQYQAPRNEIERQLVQIWRDILQIENIGIYDNFFDLGGHSLRVTELTSRIFQEWSVEIPLREIFNLLTIEKLADHILQAAPSRIGTIRVAEEREHYPMSSAQKRMFILNQLMGPNTVYNIPLGLWIDGKLDLERVKAVFQQLIQRHDSLRTSFALMGEEAVQKIHQDVGFELSYLEASAGEELMDEFVQPFDLGQPPLLRVGLVRFAAEKYFLIIDIHHIIFDGVSAGILMREFAQLYNGAELEPLQIQYKDYAVWQSQDLQSQAMKEQEEYWVNQLKEELPELKLPYDHPRSALQEFTGDGLSIELDEELTEKLHHLAQETQTSLFMILLSIYALMLAKCSGQDDLIVGTPIAGRSYVGLQKIIGMFVNTLPIRLKPTDQKTYQEFLAEVKEAAVQGSANQDYQIEEMVQRLQLDRKSNRNPLFDVTFTMQNMDKDILDQVQLEGLVVQASNYQNDTSRFDLALTALEVDQCIVLRFEYCTKLFERETILGFVDYFIRIAQQIVADLKVGIADISILVEMEEEQIQSQIEKEQARLQEQFELDFDF